ncbi:hypothetical protein BJ508DRAFT_331083 [Ascobolus immersus RN42]|uniref:Uncharacterized protein n=1 Tax=Ascobolus immersus RN42 TaxID=1160509 RepID=A0A3N4HX35_ASCIM|nr:hypothetical protein BJ508DRAFT_331083 [Ascobolus immersus RN42]
MYDTLYAAILIPLASFHPAGHGVVGHNPSSTATPLPFPTNSGLPLYGFFRGDTNTDRALVPDNLKPREIFTQKLSLLDCKGNHAAEASDDWLEVMALNTTLTNSREGQKPWHSEDYGKRIQMIEYAKPRFWECLESNKKAVGNRLQETTDLDVANPFSYPQSLGPRDFDTDPRTPEFDDFWNLRNDALCRIVAPFGWEWDLKSLLNVRQPAQCKDLDIYDSYDEFKEMFLREGYKRMPNAYKSWRDNQGDNWVWNLQERHTECPEGRYCAAPLNVDDPHGGGSFLNF